MIEAPERSVAVLPFADLSQDRDQEYFADGISEELLNLLARIPELKVAARTSSFSFRGKDVAIPEIARQLHVAHVLEGSLRKSGSRVRITAQLIHAADGFHVWSSAYDRELDDIFAIQDEIAADVVRELRITLLRGAPRVRTTDTEAYALYLRAAHLGRRANSEAFVQSDELFRRALAIDPEYAPAWEGLARNYINKAAIGLLSNEEAHSLAREAALKALAIDADYAPAHVQLGWIAMSEENDLAAAARHFERALELDGSDLGVLGNAASLLMSLGRLEEALELQETVVGRDPVNVTSLYILATAQLWAGRFDAAIASYRTVLDLNPDRGGAHYGLGVAFLLAGDAISSLAEFERERTSWRRIGLPMAYHALGRTADADAAVVELVESDASDA
ncbi:MAG TPA: tetratricopeptide repeat protein, partial [Gammaproteobacteria bacterium]|nr:tetratricopeptide repeat protein [Gammaproteobacteria bacterium]